MSVVETERQPLAIEPYIPRVLPPPWRIGERGYDGCCIDSLSLRVLASVAVERDGLKWLHLSLSRRDRLMPRWDDIQLMRAIFAPKDAHGYMCFPPESEYVHSPGAGISIEVLHIFYCLDGRKLPDFRPDTESMGL